MPTKLWHNVPMENAATSERLSLMNSLRLDLRTVETGVSVATMASFVAASGLQLHDIYDIVIPARTLKHRKARKEPLTPTNPTSSRG